MKQLTFECLIYPEEENPTAVNLAPAAIEELIQLLAVAIVAVFEGGQPHDESNRSA